MKCNKKMIPALALILVGIVFALKNIFGIDIFSATRGIINWNQIWPLILIGVGAYLIWKKSQ